MFLMNGFQLRGIITGFDCFVVVLDTEGKQQVIYKHAISTIAPMRPVELREDEAAEACRPDAEESTYETEESTMKKTSRPHENTAASPCWRRCCCISPCRAVQLPVRPRSPPRWCTEGQAEDTIDV